MLRTMTPVPIVDTQFNPQSHQSGSVSSPTPSEPVPDNLPDNMAGAKSVTISRKVSVRSLIKPSKATAKRAKLIQHDHRFHGYGIHHKVSNGSVLTVRTRTISGGHKATAWNSAKDRRCGFCLVDGFVYCGDQGVSLKNLIDQDHRNNARAKKTGIKSTQHQKGLTIRKARGRKFVHKPRQVHGDTVFRPVPASSPHRIPSRAVKASPVHKGL